MKYGLNTITIKIEFEKNVEKNRAEKKAKRNQWHLKKSRYTVKGEKWASFKICFLCNKYVHVNKTTIANQYVAFVYFLKESKQLY